MAVPRAAKRRRRELKKESKPKYFSFDPSMGTHDDHIGPISTTFTARPMGPMPEHSLERQETRARVDRILAHRIEHTAQEIMINEIRTGRHWINPSLIPERRQQGENTVEVTPWHSVITDGLEDDNET